MALRTRLATGMLCVEGLPRCRSSIASQAGRTILKTEDLWPGRLERCRLPTSRETEACLGGESPITETVGLGGFAQATAFGLQRYQGGSPVVWRAAISRCTRSRWGSILTTSSRTFGFRGTPTGIDVKRIVRTGILPVMDIGIAGRGGGQIGAGVIRAPMDCFQHAAELLE